MKFRKVSMIAVIAVLTMMLCSFIPAVGSSVSDGASQTEKQTYRYASIGDSMTVGYGLNEYYDEGGYYQYGFLMDIEDAYPHMFTEYLKKELGSGYDVQLAQLGIISSRTTDWRALIDDDFTGKDDFPGDARTKELFSGEILKAMSDAARAAYPDLGAKHPATDEGNFELVRDVYRTELANADLITYNSHNDFGYNLIVMIQNLMAGGSGIEMDFTLYSEPEYIKMAESAKASILEYLVQYLASQGIDISEYAYIIDRMATVTVYALISFCANFDAIMEYIFTVNPDAKVVVMDTYNMLIPFEVTLSGKTISVSDLYGQLLDIVNPYMEYGSPYALKCYHVDIDGLPMTFGNEFRDLDKGQISDEAKAGLMVAAGLFGETDREKAVLAYNSADLLGGSLSKFMKYVFNTHTLDADLLVGQDISEITDYLREKMMTAVKYFFNITNEVTYGPDSGSCTVSISLLLTKKSVTFTKGELSLLWAYLYQIPMPNILIHANYSGYIYIESCLEAGIEEKNILFEESSVYVSESDVRQSEQSLDLPYTLFNISMIPARSAVTYLYKDWDDFVAFVMNEDYRQTYGQIQDLYGSWQEYCRSVIDADLTDLHDRLLYLDQNWDSIFAGYTESDPVKQLHTMVLNILNNWDSFNDAVKRLTALMDQRFAVIIDALEPDTIRTLLADKESALNIRETFLNLSVNWDAFLSDIYTAAISAETPDQLMETVDTLIDGYAKPCHKTTMCPAVEPECYSDGCLEHYVCKECSAYLIQDESGRYVRTTEEGIIVEKRHTLVEHEAEGSTCIEHGNNLYYTCEKCTIVLKSDKITSTTVESETLPFSDHIHEKIPSVVPTKTHEGYTEGEKCSYCEKILIEPQVTPATGTDDLIVISDTSCAEFKVQDTDEIKSLSVKFDGSKSGVMSEISVPSGTVGNLKGKTVQFSVEKSSKLTDAYDIDMTADGSSFIGEVYISIQYDASRGTPSVKWAEDGSHMEVVSIDSSAGLVTFKTTHNSTYQVTYTAHASNDMTMIIAIAAIAVVLAALITGVIIWKKRSKV